VARSRQAHNLKVVGSNPTPQPKTNDSSQSFFSKLLLIIFPEKKQKNNFFLNYFQYITRNLSKYAANRLHVGYSTIWEFMENYWARPNMQGVEDRL